MGRWDLRSRQWGWHLLDPCSQDAAGMLQACQGDVHPENLVGSLWPDQYGGQVGPTGTAPFVLCM